MQFKLGTTDLKFNINVCEPTLSKKFIISLGNGNYIVLAKVVDWI